MNSKTTFLLNIILCLSLSLCAAQAQNAQYPNLTRTRKPFIDRRRNIAPVRISPSRLLVTIGDTLFMLNDKQQIIWKWDAGNGEDIMAQPFVDSRGNIFGIADDGLIFSLDLNGKLRWSHQAMGANFFTQLKSYRNDQFIVVLDTSAYRARRGYKAGNSLSLYKDEDVIASVDFPGGAELQVRGNHVYAILKTKRGVKSKEIKFPAVE
jgi:hypothetical protein